METWAMAASTSTSIRLPSAPPTVDVREKRIANFLLRDSTLGYLFLAPALLVIVGLVAYPFANAIVMTFQQKTAGAPGYFIGLRNYRELFAPCSTRLSTPVLAWV
jgi:ABC-type sugar transport system permease subunit